MTSSLEVTPPREMPANLKVALLPDNAKGHSSLQQDAGGNPSWTCKALKELQSRSPMVAKWSERIERVPPQYKYGCFVIWVAWKVLFAIFVLYFISSVGDHQTPLRSSTSRLGKQNHLTQQEPPPRVLYIVTSLAEYNTGKRDTIKGQDRLAEVLMPILKDSVQSIVDTGAQVDVFLILAYKLKPEREAYIREHLPVGGLQIWDEACPLGYEKKHSQNALIDNTRTLARQHRYVIRDKLPYYDLFIAVEDDMRITGDHVNQYMSTSRALEQIRAQEEGNSLFYGPLTARQLDRLVPGFVRVEVLLDPDQNGAQTKLDPIEPDYTLGDESQAEHHFDSQPCCHVQVDSNEFPQQQPLPAHPDKDNVVIWETTVRALSVRQMPENNFLDWVALLPGPGKRLATDDQITGYWSGHDGAFGKNATKPSPGEPHLIAQQGGWMATNLQIVRLQRLCQGSFLPPFDAPVYRSDGQESMNVEFWSGGYQFFTGVKGGCNMQRVISLHPDHFSKHFIYHAANNKQRQLSRERMVRADHLWGQLNAVRKAAERAKKAIAEHQ